MQRPAVIRGVILASVASAAFAGQVWAQNRDKAWEVVPEVGYVLYGEPNLGNGTTIGILPAPTNTRDVRVVTSTIKNSPSYAFRFGYHFSKKHMIEFGFSGVSTTGTFRMHKTVYDTSVTPNTVKSDVTKSESVSIDLFMAHANYIYNFFLQHRGKVVGFVTGGGGILNSSMFGQTADPDMQPIIDFLVGDENDFMYDYGAGVRFFGSEKVGFRIDARQVHFNSSTRGNQVQTEATVGLTLILGGA
jgi:hypothetical protein